MIMPVNSTLMRRQVDAAIVKSRRLRRMDIICHVLSLFACAWFGWHLTGCLLGKQTWWVETTGLIAAVSLSYAHLKYGERYRTLLRKTFTDLASFNLSLEAEYFEPKGAE